MPNINQNPDYYRHPDEWGQSTSSPFRLQGYDPFGAWNEHQDRIRTMPDMSWGQTAQGAPGLIWGMGKDLGGAAYQSIAHPLQQLSQWVGNIWNQEPDAITQASPRNIWNY